MYRTDMIALLLTLSLALLAGCAQSSQWDKAYSLVDTGHPIDMESDF